MPKKKFIRLSRALSKKTVLTVLSILATFSLFSYLIYLSPFLQIKSIECETTGGECDEKVLQLLDKLKGNRLFGINEKTRELLLKDGSVGGVSVQFRLPDKLSVKISQVALLAGIKSQEGPFYLIGRDASVSSLADKTILPVLEIRQDINYQIGDKLEAGVYNAVLLLSLANRLYGTREGVLEARVLRLKLPGGQTVIFPSSKEPEVLIGALQLVLTRIKMDEKPREIDLRYKNAILRY